MQLMQVREVLALTNAAAHGCVCANAVTLLENWPKLS